MSYHFTSSNREPHHVSAMSSSLQQLNNQQIMAPRPLQPHSPLFRCDDVDGILSAADNSSLTSFNRHDVADSQTNPASTESQLIAQYDAVAQQIKMSGQTMSDAVTAMSSFTETSAARRLRRHKRLTRKRRRSLCLVRTRLCSSHPQARRHH